MTRILTFSVIALLGLSAAPHAETKSGACGPEAWSTDKMAYVGVPCNDGQAATPQKVTLSTDAQYCGALVAHTYLNKDGRHGGMQSTNNAANVAAAKCRAGDTSGIGDLERALTDARVALPPRS
jgi:hypothetical protein